MNRRQRVVITEFVVVVVITAVVVFAILNVKDIVNRSEAIRAMQELGQRVMAYRNQNRSLPPESFISEIRESDNSSFVFHAVAALSETEQIEKIPLLLGWDDVRRAELNRIGNLNSLHKRYITGKIQKA